ncbi:MAG: ABC transporter ATP-binding protein [Lachnospiraceae bacterium]|nr:ABC transporter ATP-binding protein [Lachnospiraceae bacterium]
MSVLLPLLSSYSLKLIIDSLSVNDTVINVALLYILLYIFILVIMHFINAYLSFLFLDIVKKARHQYGCDLISNLVNLPMSFLDSSEGRDQIDDVSTTDDIAVKFSLDFIKIVSVIYSFVISYIVLSGYSLLFSTLHIIITVPSIILNAYFNDKMAWLRYKMAPDARRLSYYRWMLTNESPAKDIRMYDLTSPLKERYQKEKFIYIEKNKAIDKRKCIALLFTELIRRLGEIAFVVFVAYDAISGTISVGDVALYISLAIGATESFKSVFDLCVEYYLVRSNFMKRFFEFIQFVETTEKNVRQQFRMIENFDSLTFDNVYFKYPHTDKYVLTGVSFTINKGDKLSIVGINGSGKSTIIKLMLGLYEIESGQILINGYPMSDYDIRDVRKLFSALFQSFVQYPLTLRENIALSSLERIDDSDEIESVLRQSGVYEDIKPKLENRLDSFMTRQFDDKGTELSKGQWQKIALSRAYFKNAPIIIFDEPSAALDAEAEDRIFKNFESISDGKTGIMISHRISSARMANKIIVLDGGRITEQGTHDELVALNGLYAKFYNLQREKYTIKED